MQKFIMLFGLPASGKSYWAKAHLNESNIWISSDNFRESLGADKDNNYIFNTMRSCTIDALTKGLTVIYDATNLARKHRMVILSEVKRRFPAVFCRIEVFMAPIEVLKERNSHRTGAECVPDEVFQKMLCSFQFPQFFEGWDEIHMNEHNQYQLADMANATDFDQMNPHHKLTLWDHSSKAREIMKDHYGDAVMHEAAFFHDLGKLYTQTFDENGIAHYYGHENAGAYMYALHAFELRLFSFDEILDILFLINYHMRPYQWSDRTFQKDLKLFGADKIKKLKLIHFCDEEAH